MRDIRRGLGLGVIGGALGLAAMELIRRATKPLIKDRAHKPTDVFLTERSMSPLGPQHAADESATDALGRIAYHRLVGHDPSKQRKAQLSWAVHIGYGLLVAALYGAIRGKRSHVLRDGLVFGAGLWLFGDELAVPLLGLADKPTAYHPTRHAQSLAQHLGFGLATAATTRALEVMR